jgi:hypothetical protein
LDLEHAQRWVSRGDLVVVVVLDDDGVPILHLRGGLAGAHRRPAAEDRQLRIAWWDWPIEMITENVRTIWAGTPAEFDHAAERAGLRR